MIQYNTPLPNGGVPFFADDFTFLQGMQMGFFNIMMDEYYNLAAQVTPSGGRSLILSGLNVILSSATSISSISSGYVILGEVLYWFEGASDLSGSIYIVPDIDAGIEERPLEDQNTGLIKIKKIAKWQLTIPETGPFIAFTPLPSVYLKDLMFRASKKIGEVIPIARYAGADPLKGPQNIDLFQTSGTTRGQGLYSYNGFAICNGQNNTPNMNGRFMVGYRHDDSDYSSIGNTGPNNSNTANYDIVNDGKSIRLKTPSIPSHSHAGSSSHTGEHSHGLWLSKAPGMTGGSGGVASSLVDGNHALNGGIHNGGGHSHTITINSTGGNIAHENRPPYSTVLYIMRTS